MSFQFGKIETIDGHRQTRILTHNCDGERKRCSPQTILENIYINVHITLLSLMYFCFFFCLPPILSAAYVQHRPQYCPIPQSTTSLSPGVNNPLGDSC